MLLFITLIVIAAILGLALIILLGNLESLIKYGQFDKHTGFRKPTKYLIEQQISKVIYQIIIVILGISESLIGILILNYIAFGHF